MQRINIKEEVISISDDDGINFKKEPTVGHTQSMPKSGSNDNQYFISYESSELLWRIFQSSSLGKIIAAN